MRLTSSRIYAASPSRPPVPVSTSLMVLIWLFLPKVLINCVCRHEIYYTNALLLLAWSIRVVIFVTNQQLIEVNLVADVRSEPLAPPGARVHQLDIERLIHYELGSIEFTTQNDHDQQH